MWGRLPTELIHHIVDLLIEESGARSLYQLSLVNKAFLTYACRRLFQDLSINICRDPYVATRACHTRARCIKQLAPLLTTHVPASIPCRIRTLTLNGRDIGLNVQYFFPWLLVSNPEAMDDERVTVPVLGYFTEVEELRLVEVDLFPLSYWASFRRPFKTLLSSVRTLVLDEAKFYGGPASLHSLISEMPNLERLCIKSVTWPSEMGFPNNAPNLVILLLNCSVYYPRTCELLLQAWAWSRRAKETLFPQQWKPVPSSPRHLTLYFDEDNAALSWIMMPVLSEMLSKLSSLEIYSSCILSDQSVDGNPEFMKRFLARMPNIVHLTFQWRATGPPFDDLFQPDLSSVAVLRTLHLQIVCESRHGSHVGHGFVPRRARYVVCRLSSTSRSRWI
ncbi:hypothetical protein BDZ89DRAFT_597974 [Hymenopellis radicata]|nr:hypothetical protein BDZ89DRAFT_597974 [Hymenopellis radicata]